MAHPFGPEASFDRGYTPSPDLNRVLSPEQLAAAQREVREGYTDGTDNTSVVDQLGLEDISASSIRRIIDEGPTR